jgi:VWFA-related protein
MKIRSALWIALPVAAISICAFCAANGSGAARQFSTTASVPAAKGQQGEVRLPVLVLDKHNQLVTNLTASDFTLTEDGQPEAIKNLTTQSDLPFRLGLLVDTSRGVYPALDSERKAVDKFVDLMLSASPATGTAQQGDNTSSSPQAAAGAGRNDAFLIHFDREVELLEDFTSSPDKLHHEIDQMTATSRDVTAISRESNTQGPESDGDDNSGYGHSARNSGPQLYDAIYLASDELMKSKHGRKVLVVFSDGGDHGSKETLNDAIDAADRANLQVFTIFIKPEEERTPNANPGGGHHGGYPGSGGGWPGSGGGNRGGSAPRSEAGVDGRTIMQEIASRTGGQYFEARRKESLDQIYSDIAMLLHKEYLLTYTPDKADSEGEFHKIVLKANSKDLTVYTREGYYDPSE